MFCAVVVDVRLTDRPAGSVSRGWAGKWSWCGSGPRAAGQATHEVFCHLYFLIFFDRITIVRFFHSIFFSCGENWVRAISGREKNTINPTLRRSSRAVTITSSPPFDWNLG